MKKTVRAALRRLEIWAEHFTVIAGVAISLFYFRVLNRMRVYGRGNLEGIERNAIVASNHLSMFDSFAVGIAGFLPVIIVRPGVRPYHLAARENYFGFWLVRLILKAWRAIPVDRGRFNRELIARLLRIVGGGIIHIFPQGTRSYNLEDMRDGLGYLVAKSNPSPVVIPAYIEGTDRLFGGQPGKHSGLARWLPRFPGFGRRTTVVFGEPIRFDRSSTSKDEDIRRVVTERIVTELVRLRDSLRQKPMTAPVST
ncbi:MAG: 1-acyl-sn-glycerol-3-phosphate acyltransferase [Candidatus Liptonbacteria bacterium]|nr:1-acyl-sn-glycerol-3-phosphate acyltransferase [Candidatus Liptonbacteria bacterium]